MSACSSKNLRKVFVMVQIGGILSRDKVFAKLLGDVLMFSEKFVDFREIERGSHHSWILDSGVQRLA